jgi:hypothetical protein
MHATGWSRGLEVTGGGTGIVSHAGLVLLRAPGCHSHLERVNPGGETSRQAVLTGSRPSCWSPRMSTRAICSG